MANVADVFGSTLQSTGKELFPVMQMLADKKREAALDTLDRTFRLEGLKMETESLKLRGEAGERAETRLGLDVAGDLRAEERLQLDKDVGERAETRLGLDTAADLRAEERLTLDKGAGGRAERRLLLEEEEKGKPSNLEEFLTDRVGEGSMTLKEAFSLMSTKKTSQPKGKTSGELAVGASQKFLAGDVAGAKGKEAHEKYYRGKPAVLSDEDMARGATVLMTDPDAGLSLGIPRYEQPKTVDTTKVLAQTFTLAGDSERATPGETATDLLNIHPGLQPKIDEMGLTPAGEPAKEPEVSDEQVTQFKETLKTGTPEEQRKILDKFITDNMDQLPITDWESGDYTEKERDEFRNYIRELILKQ